MENTALRRLSEYNNILKENNELYRHAAKLFGLSECAFWILYVLRTEAADLTQSKLCAFLYHPKQTVHSALNTMEADDLITRSCGSNRRSKYIRLTEKGVLLAQRTADQILRAECSALAGLTDREQTQFLSLQKKYTALLRTRIQALGVHRETDL